MKVNAFRGGPRLEPYKIPLVRFNDSSDPSHFIFEINVSKRQIRHSRVGTLIERL